MKTIQSRALVVAVASILGTAAHAQGNASTANLSSYRSVMSPQLAIDDSFNRTTDTKITTDNSRSAVGSFNRSTDVDTKISTDNSRSAVGSFNRSTETTIDASRRSVDSHDTSLDYQVVSPDVRMNKSIATQDTQSASNSGYMGGATQVGKQGDFNLTMGGGSQGVSAWGGKNRSPASASAAYDIGQSNRVDVGGDNNGLIRAQNNLNLGGSQINDSDLGNKQSFYAGDQTQVQGNTQDKHSATQTYSSDVVSTRVSK